MNTSQIQFILDAFDACTAFGIFTQAEKTQLARKSQVLTFKAHQEVFSFEHKGGDCLFLVADGSFKLRLKKNKFKQFSKGEIFGEIAVFHEKSRTGIIHAETDGALVAICRDVIMRESLLPSELRYKLLLILAQQMAGYFHENNMANTRDLIARGESETVEFKSNLDEKDSIARTICAFLNKHGGTVFVGVGDGGKVFGIGESNTASKKILDQYKRDIGTFTKKYLGALANQRIEVDFESVSGKLVLRIDCIPSEAPVFYREKSKGNELEEIFYVRHDTRNEKFERPSELIRYAAKRFPS